ncbi:MAG TPA: DUF3052 domain-containing protein [Actinomycetota bacterium]|nr:DUF3052 domain-containing protein [Actinomycetota bacterium]
MGAEGRDGSGTPLPRKLGIRAGSRLLVLGAPGGFSLGELPPGVRTTRSTRGEPLDVVLLFVTRRAELDRRFAGLAAALDPAGRLWVAWPKKASDLPTDLTFEAVQRTGLEAGLVDNKSAAVDADFQGLQFVYRLKDRPTR